MGLINAVYVQDDFASVLSIKKKRKSYHVVDSELLDTGSLKEYLKKRGSFYVSVEEDELIDEKITLSSLIKNDNVIRSSILHKLQESLNRQSILFSYKLISHEQHDEKNTYQVDGVYENGYIKSLQSVGKIDDIQNATASRFALFAIAKECIKDDSYFCVYTQANRVMVLAIHNEELIFSRSSTILVENANERQMAIVDEINRTIAYIHQQFRDITFSLIALSGSMSIDDIVPEHLHMLTQLPISVLYPNSFIKGLENEMLQHYILALGALFIPKDLVFLPADILGARQYSMVLQTMLFLSVVALAVSSFFTSQSFTNYSDELDRYESIKNRLIRTVRNTDTYSKQDLQKSWNHLQIAEKYLQYNPLDLMISIKPLTKFIKPTSWKWRLENSYPQTEIEFEKSFKSLDTMYKFEKQFNKIYNDINKSLTITLNNKSDYKKMIFKNILEIKKEKKRPQRASRRRRR